jgi:hypothetical protein
MVANWKCTCGILARDWNENMRARACQASREVASPTT